MVITVPKAPSDLLTRTSMLADGRMVVTRRVHAGVDEVWAVLADGWRYATWMVGVSRVRDVDPAWPGVGSRLRHAEGPWPVAIDHHTEILACDPGRRLLLKAGGWPLGATRLRIMVNPGSTHGSIIRLTQDVTDARGRLIPRPVRQRFFAARSEESLRRLAFIAEGHHRRDRRRSAREMDDATGTGWLRTS